MRAFIIFHNRYFILSILLIFINLILSGCYSSEEITHPNDTTIKIYKIELRNGNIVDFKNTKWGYAAIIDSNVVTIKSNGEKEQFPMTNVKKYYTEKLDATDTILLLVGCAVLVVGIIFISSFKTGISGPNLFGTK